MTVDIEDNDDQRKPNHDDQTHLMEIGNIEFSKVSFKDNYGNYLLKDFDLKIEMNKINVVCGPSGCGISLISQLILKHFEPHSGKISIGGTDLNLINDHSLRTLIGHVGFENNLFDISIDANVTAGLNKVLDKDQLENLNFITDSNSFWTVGETNTVGFNGSKLSRGEIQRVALARALARNNMKPSLLIIDQTVIDPDKQKYL